MDIIVNKYICYCLPLRTTLRKEPAAKDGKGWQRVVSQREMPAADDRNQCSIETPRGRQSVETTSVGERQQAERFHTSDLSRNSVSLLSQQFRLGHTRQHIHIQKFARGKFLRRENEKSPDASCNSVSRASERGRPRQRRSPSCVSMWSNQQTVDTQAFARGRLIRGSGKGIKQFCGTDRIKSRRTAINFFPAVRRNAPPTFNRFH